METLASNSPHSQSSLFTLDLWQFRIFLLTVSSLTLPYLMEFQAGSFRSCFEIILTQLELNPLKSGFDSVLLILSFVYTSLSLRLFKTSLRDIRWDKWKRFLHCTAVVLILQPNPNNHFESLA